MSGNLKALRLQNLVLGGLVTGPQLETELGTAAKLGAWRAMMGQRSAAGLILGNATARPIVLASALARGAIGTTQVAQALVADLGALAGVVGDSGAAATLAASPSARSILMASTEALRVIGGRDGASLGAGQFANYYTWKQRHGDLPTSSVRQIAYGNGMHVAATNSALHYSSDGGATWTQAQTVTNCIGVVFNAATGTFVAATEAGYIYTSGDGAAWSNFQWNASASYYCIATNGSRVVVMGNSSYMIYSDNPGPNASDWTVIPTRPNTNVYNVAWNGSVFAACTISSNTTSVWSSPNGTVWTQRTHALTTPSNQTRCLGAADGVFMLANGSNNQLATSTDGVTWTNRALTHQVDMTGGGGGLCVAFNSSGDLSTSADGGVTWVRRGRFAIGQGATGRISVCNGQILIPTTSNKYYSNF